MIHICAIFLCRHTPDVWWHAALWYNNINSWKGSNWEIFCMLNITLETRLADSARACVYVLSSIPSSSNIPCFGFADAHSKQNKSFSEDPNKTNELNLKDFILLSSQLEAEVHQRETNYKIFAFRFCIYHCNY